MSKRSSQNFKYTKTAHLPKCAKIKTEWDLKKHYYTSEHDPQIERDVAGAERAYRSFAHKYRHAHFTETTKALKKALSDYEKLIALPEGRRATRYFGFRHALNAKDSVAEKRSNLIEERLTKAGNELLFFEIALGKIPKKLQLAYLKEPALVHFRYYLKQVFEQAKHTLTEPEERILSLKAGPSSGMWVQGTEKIIANRQITYRGKRIAIPEALELIDTLPPKEKERIWNLILVELEQISEVAENEFNAIITNKKISDELRKYEKPYSATVLSYENSEKSVEALVEAISTDGFAQSRKFYELKARYHGMRTLPYVRKYDAIGAPVVIPFSEAVDICRDVFYRVHPEYGQFFDTMLTEGRVDAFPKQGKRGGAFMSADLNVPTFVFLNHTNDLSSLTTLAHEMGHAVHAERSKGQSPLYQDFSTTTAETASTLFENILMNELIRQSTDTTRLMLLHERITRSIATIQRQIAFFNFELDLHTHIRKEGATTKEELATMMRKHLSAYLGKGVEVTERDGYSYVYIPHFRYGFYVYTYTYGHLMSSLMANRLAENSKYVEKIDVFLTAGGTDTVENIFKQIGIDASKPATFREGLTMFENDVQEFERLIKKKK